MQLAAVMPTELAIPRQSAPAVRVTSTTTAGCRALARTCRSTLCRGTKASDPFVRELIDLGAGALVHGGVMRHPLFPEGKPKPRTGPDMVDRMVELLKPHLKSLDKDRSDNDGAGLPASE